jgi:hypothetical protein
MTGGVYGAAVGLCAFLSGSGSETVVGPSFTSALPGPAGFENGGSDVSWRAYHRSVKLSNSVNLIGLFLYHENRIWENSAPPAWTVAHTTASQNTARGSGDHTGLYPVQSLDGSRMWVCGLYRTAGNTIGWVKWDTLTNTWTSGDSGLGSHTTPFSVCTQWQGRLAHAGSSGLVLFNPETNQVVVQGYGGTPDFRDWVHAQDGRLFIVSRRGGSTLEILEYLGFVMSHGTVTGASENTTSGGGWSVGAFSDGIFYVFYYSTSGGTGWRCEKVAVGSTTPMAALTLSDITNPVIPDGSGGNSPGAYRWPASAGASNAGQMFLPGIDNAEWPRGAFGTSGGPFNVFHLQAQGAGGTKFGTAHSNLLWNGEGALITTDSPTGTSTMNGLYSYPITRWGRGAKDLNGGTGPWIESVEAYSDGTVARGLLIKFRLNGVAAVQDFQILGSTPCTLSVGDGLPSFDIGGTGTINVAGKSVDEVLGKGSANAILDHGVPSSGPGFVVGEVVTGSSSGSTGLVRSVRGPTINRIGVTVTGGPGFTAADTITGGTSTTVAALLSAQDANPLMQIVWDLDADSVPDFAYAELSTVVIPTGTSRPPGNFGGYVVGPVQVIQVPESVASEDTLQTAGPPQEVQTLSDSSASQTAGPPQEVQVLSDSNAAQTAGPPQEMQVLSDNNATQTAGPPQEVSAEGDYLGDLRQRVAGRAHSEPDALTVEIDFSVEFQRRNVNLVSAAELDTDCSQAPNAEGGPQAQIKYRRGALPEFGTIGSATVDLASLGNTAVLLVPAGKEAVVLGVMVRVQSGTATAPAHGGLGTNAGADNVFVSQPFAGVLAPEDVYEFPVGGVGAVALAGETISFGVDVVADAAQTAEVVLLGYLKDA